MTTLVELPPENGAASPAVTTRFDSCRWLRSSSIVTVTAAYEFTTGADEEACVLLLSGTFDLIGGSSSWPSRGARTAPEQGRPVVVFLPPGATFRATPSSGSAGGELLVVTASRPSQPRSEGLAALSEKPLLPLAGSDKSFDPATGEWRPAETFADAPEHLTPRRMTRLVMNGTTVERVLAADYKALALTLDEVVLQPGATLSAGSLDWPGGACEAGIHVRSAGTVTLRGGDRELATTGGTPPGHTLQLGSTPAQLSIEAGDQVAWVAIFSAAK